MQSQAECRPLLDGHQYCQELAGQNDEVESGFLVIVLEINGSCACPWRMAHHAYAAKLILFDIQATAQPI